MCVCLFVPCGHLPGKGWPLGSCLWRLTVSLSLSQWYPGSGVVLDCIHSLSTLIEKLIVMTKTLQQATLILQFISYDMNHVHKNWNVPRNHRICYHGILLLIAFYMLCNFSCFCCRLVTFFSKLTFSKNSFRNTIRVSNSLNLRSGWMFCRSWSGWQTKLFAKVISRKKVTAGK